MNRIRTVAAAVALLAGAATFVGAQAPGAHKGHAGKAHPRAQGMLQELDLTPAQQEQIKAIHAKYRVQFQQLRQQQHAEIRAVLTAEQQVKFDARHAQMRERMAQRDSTRRKAGARGTEGRRHKPGARPRR